MKKIFLSVIACCFICTGCNKPVELDVPEEIEPTIEEIKKSNLEVAKTTFMNIKKTADLYFLEMQIDVNYVPTIIKINFSDVSTIPDNFVFNGTMPTSGILTIDENGNVSLENIEINNLICNYDNNEVICN